MWKWLKRGLGWVVDAPEQPARIRIGRPRGPSVGPLLHVSFDRPPIGGAWGGWLPRVRTPGEVEAVVRFATRRRLPVAGWVLWGFDTIPRRVELRARWLASVAERIRPAPLWLVATRRTEPDGRLAANLRRHDCRVERVDGSIHGDSSELTG